MPALVPDAPGSRIAAGSAESRDVSSILHSAIMARLVRFECDGRLEGPREIVRVACDQPEQAHPVDLDRLLTVGGPSGGSVRDVHPGISEKKAGFASQDNRSLILNPEQIKKINSHWSVGSSVRTVGNGRRAVRRVQVDSAPCGACHQTFPLSTGPSTCSAVRAVEDRR